MTKRSTYITSQQALIHGLFVRYRSMSVVARDLGLSQIRVREALVQHQRNVMRDAGQKPPPLRDMLRGDVTTRFGVSREEFGGRPAKHPQFDHPLAGEAARIMRGADPRTGAASAPRNGVARYLITAVEYDGRVHSGFWKNLKAYAAAIGATLVVMRIGAIPARSEHQSDWRGAVVSEPVVIGDLVDLAVDEGIGPRIARPLDTVRHRCAAQWTVFPHAAVQLETLSRIRADGLRVHLTTGAMTIPRSPRQPWRRELGAVIVEVSPDCAAHCRHVLADLDGDGTFQDLNIKVSKGVVYRGCRAEALTFGDIHHAHLDLDVATATWGTRSGEDGLVDALRPRMMIFHDVCDFDARNAHDARDYLKRFTQYARGGGDVGAEMAGAARFLAETRRSWSRSIVVGSNHDEGLVRWLREGDFRDDPVNAIFFLEHALALHRRLLAGKSVAGFFEHTLRGLSEDRLEGIRFLRPNESLKICGIESAIHGHVGADGVQGSLRFYERMGVRATMGHTHRPLARDGIYCTGVCAPDLGYAKGVVTRWAVGHVATYSTGARAHLFYNGGRFCA